MAKKRSARTPKPGARSFSGDLQLKTLMDHVVDGVVIIDQIGTVREFNPAAEKIFGYGRDEVVGRNVNMLMPEPYHSAHDRYLSNYLRTGEAKIIGVGREVEGKRKNGEVFPMELSVGEIPGRAERVFIGEDSAAFRLDEGELPGHAGRLFVGSIRDLTERKAMERQLLHSSKMEAMGQLTGGIAHDFNNLLAVLMMDLEILEDLTEDSERRRELVREARDITRSAADLTNRLLAFSRRQPLQPATVDLTDLIADTTGLLRRTLGETVEIDTSAPTDLWPVKVDRGQLESSILNLALNARDAMPNGGRLAISTANFSKRDGDARPLPDLATGDYVRIEVRDTGSGMSEEVVARAFEPFFTTKSGSGTGLGLATVYGFARQSGGIVQIESAIGRGTTVSLFLPRALVPPPAPTGRQVRLPTGGGEKILVVEDDDRLRKRGRAALEELGYATLEAANAFEALRVLDANADIALLFTDIVTPGGTDGVELARKARALRPRLKVLLTSGYAEYSALDLSTISEGILRKPYRRRELAERIRAALDSEARADG
jgi:PAS domain S-box-containing protein